MNKRKALAILAGLLGFFLGVDWLISNLPFAESQLTELTELQSKQIDIYVATTQQLLGFTSLLLAGVGVFASSDTTQAAAKKARTFLLWVAALAAFSIYMGHLRLEYTVWMVANSFVNLGWAPLYWVGTLQFWSFVGGVTLFAWIWLTHK